MFLHHARDGFLLGAVFGRGARALFRDRLLLGAHARRHLGLGFGHRLLVLQASSRQHALRFVAHFVRLVARLLGDRGFLARRFADELFSGSADLQSGLGLRFGYFPLALGLFARRALGIDAVGELSLRLAVGFFACRCDLGLGGFAHLALGRDARFDFRARAALGLFARLAHGLVARLALDRDQRFGLGARFALGRDLFARLGLGQRAGIGFGTRLA